MNERINSSRRVIKRTLTITTIETWVFTLCWWDGETPAEDEMVKPEPIDPPWKKEEPIEV